MTEANAGYITDVEYMWGYFGEISPLYLNWVAASAGHVPRPLDRPFRYLELGCGHGVSLNVHAVAHPNGQFVGLDFNKVHADNARAMAERGKLPNVTVIHGSFSDFLRDHGDLGKFDFIALHGILTWISPELQEDIVDIVNAMALPGAIVYMSYNAYPGCSSTGPVRKLMSEMTKDMEGDSRDRARAGLAFVESMLETKPKAFGDGERVKKLLAHAREGHINYVTHEYFNVHWYPFWLCDMAERFARAGLTYAGSTRLGRNLFELNLTPDQQKVLSTVQDPLRRVQFQDIVLDEPYREDVYVRGEAVPVPKDFSKLPALLDLYVGTSRYDRDLHRKLRVAAGVLEFTQPFHEKLYAKLRAGNYTIREYLDEITDRPRERIAKVLQYLAVARFLRPVQGPRPVVAEAVLADPHQRWKLTNPWNQAVVERRLIANEVRFLATPITGAALPLTMTEACILLGLCAAGPAGAVAHANALLAKNGRRIVQGEHRVQPGEEQTRLLGEELAGFTKEKLARLVRLGTLAPV